MPYYCLKKILMLKNIINTVREILGRENIDIRMLAGYENYNFLVKTGNGKYVFKMYPFNGEVFEFLKAENDILLKLTAETPEYYPRPVAFNDGKFLKTVEKNGQKYICRTLTFLEGKFVGELPLSEKLMSSFGNFLANIDVKLKTIENGTVKNMVNEWDIQHLNLNEKLFKYIYDTGKRKTVEYFYNAFYKHAYPHLVKLPKQIIHNDANEWNTLTKNGFVTGIIDFGDMVYSQRINEPAIAIAYSCFNTREPLKWASRLLQAYHKILPVTKTEAEILYYLVAARLVMSVSHSAYSKSVEPGNPHRFISEKPAWNLLNLWKSTGPDKAAKTFVKSVSM